MQKRSGAKELYLYFTESSMYLPCASFRDGSWAPACWHKEASGCLAWVGLSYFYIYILYYFS